MLLGHPNLPSCDDCERFAYDTDTWQRQYYRGQPARRPPGTPTPCSRCPKCKEEKEASPAAGRRNELSRRNWQCLRGYYQHKAVGGVVDELAAANYGVIEQMVSMYHTQQQAAVLAVMAAR